MGGFHHRIGSHVQPSHLVCPTCGKANTPEVLSCWKDIARFFGKGVRTVQRWETEWGMPVYRLAGERGIVFAHPEELRFWATHASMPRDYVELLLNARRM